MALLLQAPTQATMLPPNPSPPSKGANRIDYAFRAVHLTAVEAKGIAAAYYGRFPAYSYWDGCSTGGRQGLILAQRFPSDFDGIVAGPQC
jgi:Tannase and feruloyl esterase